MPLLSVFAGGCLSGAALLSFWRGDPPAVPSSKLGANEPIVETPPLMPPSSEHATLEDAADAHATNHGASAVDDSHHVGDAGSPSPKNTEGIVADPPAEPGSSVADVLLSLEAAYRQGLEVARAVEQTSAPVATLPRAPASISELPASVPPAPAAPAALVAPAAPVAPAAAVTLAVPTVPVPIQPASAPPIEAAPASAARQAPPRYDVHVGDVHQNTTVGTLNQGDVYLLQQLAILQNLQLYGLTPYGRATAPAHTPRGTTRRAPPFPTSLTNPDNPWGFDFPPTVLVK